MPENDNRPAWYDDAVEWYALPTHLRRPKTAQEWYNERGVNERTFYRWTDKEEFNTDVVTLALSKAKKKTADVLAALADRALNGSVNAQIAWLKYINQIAERISREDKVTTESKTIFEIIDKTSKKLEEDGVNVDELQRLLQSVTVNKPKDSSDLPDAPSKS